MNLLICAYIDDAHILSYHNIQYLHLEAGYKIHVYSRASSEAEPSPCPLSSLVGILGQVSLDIQEVDQLLQLLYSVVLCFPYSI